MKWCVQGLTEDQRAKFPGVDKVLAKLEVVLEDEAKVTVLGFGMPFSNPGHASEDWIQQNKPMIGKHSLVEVLERRSFTFIVATPTAKLNQSWD
jgi:hypothetical protein